MVTSSFSSAGEALLSRIKGGVYVVLGGYQKESESSLSAGAWNRI